MVNLWSNNHGCKVNIEGLGEIEIQGDTPTPEEEKAILEALGATTDTTDTIEIEEQVDTCKFDTRHG